ncbi:hypothetical protein ACOV11_07140 [Vibrio natriegens]
MSNLKFCPDISEIDSVEFRPYMIENAYDYFIISTNSPHQRMGIQSVLSALCIEIILKSFHVTVASNHGKLNETYVFSSKESLPRKSNPHDLMTLYYVLPENIKRYLFDAVDLKVLLENKELFTQSRYAYEPNANTIHHDDIVKLAASLICKIVYLYREFGCTDPFIEYFNIEELYFTRVQQFVWYSE